MTDRQLEGIKNSLEKSKEVNTLISNQNITEAYNLNLEVWKELQNVVDAERLKDYLR